MEGIELEQGRGGNEQRAECDTRRGSDSERRRQGPDGDLDGLDGSRLARQRSECGVTGGGYIAFLRCHCVCVTRERQTRI